MEFVLSRDRFSTIIQENFFLYLVLWKTQSESVCQKCLNVNSIYESLNSAEILCYYLLRRTDILNSRRGYVPHSPPTQRRRNCRAKETLWLTFLTIPPIIKNMVKKVNTVCHLLTLESHTLSNLCLDNWFGAIPLNQCGWKYHISWFQESNKYLPQELGMLTAMPHAFSKNTINSLHLRNK